MGWSPSALNGKQFLILSTQGGIREPDGQPVALGYHTGHWEVGLLMQAAAQEFKLRNCLPFAGFCTDPCDGRTQGTTGMMDSLPYRNDAAQVFRRLIRSIPTRHGVMGVATCDKGLPAMMMALASMHQLPCILVPGGVTLPPEEGEDAGAVQSLSARFAHGEVSFDDAAELLCSACATPGGGCQFLGTAATSQVVGEALGLSLPHSALAPSGQSIWLDMARRSARALIHLEEQWNSYEADSDRKRLPECHGSSRGFRRVDQSSPPHSCHRPCGRNQTSFDSGLDRPQSSGSPHRRCPPKRSHVSSDYSRISWLAASRKSCFICDDSGYFILMS